MRSVDPRVVLSEAMARYASDPPARWRQHVEVWTSPPLAGSMPARRMMAWDAAWDSDARAGKYAFERSGPFGDILVDIRAFSDAVFTRHRGVAAVPAVFAPADISGRTSDDGGPDKGETWGWVEHGAGGAQPELVYGQASPLLFGDLYAGAAGDHGAMVRAAVAAEPLPEACDAVEVVLPRVDGRGISFGGFSAFLDGLAEDTMVVARVSIGQGTRLVHSEDVVLRGGGVSLRVRVRTYAFGSPVAIARPDADGGVLPSLPKLEGRVSGTERLVAQVVDLRLPGSYALDVPFVGRGLAERPVVAGDAFTVRMEGDVACLVGDVGTVYVRASAFPGVVDGSLAVAEGVRTLDMTDLTIRLSDGGDITSGQYTSDVDRVADDLRGPLVVVREWSGDEQIVAAIETADGRRLL